MKPLSLLVLSAVLGLAGCAKKQTDAELLAFARKGIHGRCLSAGQGKLPAQLLDKFCTCSTERAVVALGAAGVRRLKDVDDKLPDDVQRLTLEAGQHCAAELQRG